MTYPSAVNLPFNFEVIRECFVPAKPGEAVPEGPGYWAVLQGGALVVRETADGYSLPEGERPSWLPPGSSSLCIGLWQGKPLRAAVVGRETALPSLFVAEQFNTVFERLDDRLLTIGGFAHQILQWQRLCAVCSRCGGEVDPIPGTWGKRCRSCRHEHFPHIHPCAIVLVKRGDEFLLVRKESWPAGRYSLIAGFVDPGESLEECALREVTEEAGIVAASPRYVGSQNWPFPSQLMAGFVADYAGGDIMVDGEEIEDARWFSAGDMPSSLPSRRSIARWIIDRYALGTDEI